MRVYIKQPESENPVTGKTRYWVANVPPEWVKRHDNGAMISCGLTVGSGGLTKRQFNVMKGKYPCKEVTQDEWNHSGCQSSCKRRGDKECRW